MPIAPSNRRIPTWLAFSLGLVVAAEATPMDPAKRAIVGYWHNFSNGSVDLRLTDIPDDYNVIDVAFLEQVPGSNCAVQFTPYATMYPDSNLFRTDVQTLQRQGRKVLLSLGGQNGAIKLADQACTDRFVSDAIRILKDYGFDGLDIDLEGASLSGVEKTADFGDPGTKAIVNLNQAVDRILLAMGPSFWLTAAPETYYVQGADDTYAGLSGAYLPFLYHFRERLEILHPQLYNGSQVWTQAFGTLTEDSPEFMVYMCELLLQGFVAGAGATGPTFPPFQARQIAIGKPATPGAAGHGYSSPAQISEALGSLIAGKKGLAKDVLRRQSGYPQFRGVMTWSINWDKTRGYSWSRSLRQTLDSLGDPEASFAPTDDSPRQGTPRFQGGALVWDAGLSGMVTVRSPTGKRLLEAQMEGSDRLPIGGLRGVVNVTWPWHGQRRSQTIALP